jgi:hypothetical protein
MGSVPVIGAMPAIARAAAICAWDERGCHATTYVVAIGSRDGPYGSPNETTTVGLRSCATRAAISWAIAGTSR